MSHNLECEGEELQVTRALQSEPSRQLTDYGASLRVVLMLLEHNPRIWSVSARTVTGA